MGADKVEQLPPPKLRNHLPHHPRVVPEVVKKSSR